jgi:hypothetical protein
MLLSPHEYLRIVPTINDLVRTSNTERTIAVLLDFISRLEILDRSKDDDKEQATIGQCLRDALRKAGRPTLVTSRLRTARKRGIDGDFPCLHVVVTPTRVSLEGPSPEQVSL